MKDKLQRVQINKYGDQYGNWHNEAPLPEIVLSAKG